MILLKPLVSIIIPVYNQEAFLAATLDSVLQQTYPHFEVILIDDGSTDKTPSICQTYCQQDKRFSYYRQPNQGPSAARHNGIHRSKGEYICLLDGDDLMAPTRLESQLEQFQQDYSIDIIYTALKIIDEKGSEIGEVRGHDYSPEDFLVFMLFRNVIPALSTTMIKRKCLLSYSFDFHLRHAEDYELMLRLAQYYRFKYVDIPLTLYRRHKENLSNNLKAHRQAELKILNRYDDAFIDQAIAKSSLTSETKVLMKGKILFNREKWQEALSTFREIPSALSYFYMGICYFKLNQLDKAMESFQASLQQDENNPACHNNLGVVCYLLGQPSEAHFRKALELKPGYLDALDNLSLREGRTPKLTLKELRRDILPYLNKSE